jgi:ArsR family metal-binding transcriptional regulator
MMSETADDARVIAEVYKLLPGKNCGEKSPCGVPKCTMFAREVFKGKKEIHDCPFMEDDNLQAVILVLEEYFR